MTRLLNIALCFFVFATQQPMLLANVHCLSLLDQYRLERLKQGHEQEAPHTEPTYYDVSAALMGPVFDINTPVGRYISTRFERFSNAESYSDRETYIRAIHRKICLKLLKDLQANPRTPLTAPPTKELEPIIDSIEAILISQK